jgi:hypothetical protein
MSVPAQGDLRAIVPDVAAKIAEFLGQNAEPAALKAAIDSVARQVAPTGADTEITFEFRQADADLVIEAHCGGRTSEVRCPLAV